MARPRIYKTQGVVLKQTPIGEADRILSILTPDLGKVRVVARGGRRPPGPQNLPAWSIRQE